MGMGMTSWGREENCTYIWLGGGCCDLCYLLALYLGGFSLLCLSIVLYGNAGHGLSHIQLGVAGVKHQFLLARPLPKS